MSFYRLTPAEIEALRQEMREAGAAIKAEIASARRPACPLRGFTRAPALAGRGKGR